MRLPNLERHIKKIEQFTQELPRNMQREFVKETPIRTGNARRSTSLKANSIDANYGYAAALNQGRSRQAPNGMTDPTIEYARQQLRRLT